MSVRQTMRRRLAAVRDRVDGWLHPRRYRHAAARLQEVEPRTVLIVCLGNICRSPYAEWVMSAEAKGRLSVDSAGFIGPGRTPPEPALAAALARGVDHPAHRSKVLSADMIDAADVMLVFDRGNYRRLVGARGARPDRVFYLGDFDPSWSGRRAIPDPWGQPEEAFHSTFERIERCVKSFLGALPSLAEERTDD